MAQTSDSRFSTPKQGLATAGIGEEGAYASGIGSSYTVTFDASPSVEQSQMYMTKTPSPVSIDTPTTDFDFMSSSSLGSPTGKLVTVLVNWSESQLVTWQIYC